MSKARVIEHNGQLWVSLEDIRLALKDDDAVMKAAAMLKVSRDKGDPPLEILRRGIAFFVTELTGILDHESN